MPESWYAYDLRGSDYDPGEPVTVEPSVIVNHAGTILTHEPISFPKEGFKRLSGRLDFADAYHLSLREFCDERGLDYPENNRKFILRPASPDEAGLFYSQDPEQDKKTATVGHLRLDFGSSGREFWTTWWPHSKDALTVPAFKAELDSLVNRLRNCGPLKDRAAMCACCDAHGESKGNFIIETERYRYCLRCEPVPGNYDGYLYAYDKRQQELNLQQEAPQEGMTMGEMHHGF